MEKGGGMRVNVDELLKTHASAIQELRTAVADVLPAGPCYKDGPGYDDVFLLRFVLTWEKKGGLMESAPALREAIKFRTENAGLLDRTCDSGLEPHHELTRRFMTAGYAGTMGGMEPIYIVRTGFANLKALMNSLTADEATEMLSISKEIGFRICDKMTRKTRTLVKMITVIDLANFSLFGGEPRFYKSLGESSKHSAVNYPQLLGKTVLINTPSFMRIIFGAFSVFMPKSALEKTCICPAGSTWEKVGDQGVAACPFIKKWGASASDFPTFLGGTAEAPAELQARAGVLAGLTKVTVNARSKEVVSVMIPEGACEAKWELVVEDFGIGMEATLVPDDGTAPICVMQYQKIKAASGLATGVVSLPKKGTLQVTFDNTYSLLRSKTFDYTMDVNPGGTAGLENAFKTVSVSETLAAVPNLQM